jgi:hypothetical protein
MTVIRILSATALAAGLLAGCADAKTAQAEGAGGNIAVGSFDNVELRGGGHVILRYGASERVTLLQGSTQFTRFRVEDSRKLVIDACNSDCPSHYDLEIEIVTPHIAGVAISGGGRIDASAGFPAQDRISAAVDGGGDIELTALDARDAEAAVDGGGKIHVRADERLNAAVDGGGAIRYAGNPQVTSAIDGGGSVRPEGS